MARLTIDTGTPGNTATGDSLRGAFTKVNANFQELYDELGTSGILSDLSFSGNTISTDGTNQNLILDPNGTGKVIIEGTVDLGGLSIASQTITGLTTNSNITLSPAGTGAVDVDTSRIINLSDPTSAQDAATKAYVDTPTNMIFTLGSNTLSGTTSQFNSALVDGDFATLAGIEIITNKTISGSNNTISNIGNASLANSTVTIVGDDSTGNAISLGETLKIVGTQNITTAVSGDTLTITGPDLSSFLTNSTITVVGDDSTGTILNSNETIKIAGAQNITTAVSGDTLTITGPDLSSYATQSFVDSALQGLDIKNSVRLATTLELTNEDASPPIYDNGTAGVGATLTFEPAILFIDGVGGLQNGDRILIKDQSNQATNGIYVRTSGTVYTRAVDADSASELTGGTFVFVEQGTVNGDSGFVFTHNGTPTVGTTALTVSQFSGAGQITAGAGLEKSGNTLSVADGAITNSKLQNSGIIVVDDTSTASTISLGETLKIAGGTGITTAVSADTITITGTDLSSYLQNTGTQTIDNLTFNDNIISTSSNADLVLDAGGTGKVTTTSQLEPNLFRAPRFNGDAAANSAHGSKIGGEIYYDTSTNQLKGWNGSIWYGLFS